MTQEKQEIVCKGKELVICPDCGESVYLEDQIESLGDGIAFGYIECDACDFRGREEWVIDRTVRVK